VNRCSVAHPEPPPGEPLLLELEPSEPTLCDLLCFICCRPQSRHSRVRRRRLIRLIWGLPGMTNEKPGT